MIYNLIYNFIIFLIILWSVFYVLDKLKDKTKSDVIFLIIFFLLSIIPVLHINNEIYSSKENKFLVKYTPLFNSKNKINFEFSKNFDAYFNDRFNLRYLYTHAYNFLQYDLGECVNRKYFYDKKNEFMYFNWEFGNFTNLEIKENLKALKKFNEFLKTNNIKLYVLIVPRRIDIYPTDKYKNVNYSLADKFYEYLNNKENEIDMKIIFPLNELREGAKDNFMFFKTEHHWTEDGAFIGYKKLMEEIKKDFPSVKILNDSDFKFSYNNLIRADFSREYRLGTAQRQMGLPDINKYKKINYRFYRHKDFINLIYSIPKADKKNEKNFYYGDEKIFYYPKGKNYKVLLLGSSQGENLTEFIPFTFKNVYRISNNMYNTWDEDFKILKYYKKTILNYKPDILIFCISYYDIVRLHNILSME